MVYGTPKRQRHEVSWLLHPVPFRASVYTFGALRAGGVRQSTHFGLSYLRNDRPHLPELFLRLLGQIC